MPVQGLFSSHRNRAALVKRSAKGGDLASFLRGLAHGAQDFFGNLRAPAWLSSLGSKARRFFGVASPDAYGPIGEAGPSAKAPPMPRYTRVERPARFRPSPTPDRPLTRGPGARAAARTTEGVAREPPPPFHALPERWARAARISSATLPLLQRRQEREGAAREASREAKLAQFAPPESSLAGEELYGLESLAEPGLYVESPDYEEALAEAARRAALAPARRAAPPAASTKRRKKR